MWVKRSDYVIVERGASQEADATDGEKKESGIRFIISHILYRDQVNHLKKEGLWPDDPQFVGDTDSNSNIPTNSTTTGDGIVYSEYDEELDDDLFVNTNRVHTLQIQDSSSDDDTVAGAGVGANISFELSDSPPPPTFRAISATI